MKMKTLISSCLIGLATMSSANATGFSSSSEGAISIPIKEYERLKEIEEGDKEKQYWTMSFEQILGKVNNDRAKAVDLYEFWVERKVELNGAVNGSSADYVISIIRTLNEISEVLPITLIVNSPGGSVLDGLEILNAMDNSRAQVDTVCDTWAMSMGAIIFAHGTWRKAEPGCIFMIHEVGVGAQGGQTFDHVKWAETIIQVEDVLVQYLMADSGLDYDEVQTLMEYETWWNAQETKDLGFADEVLSLHFKEAIDIPENLLPANRMRKNFDKKLRIR